MKIFTNNLHTRHTEINTQAYAKDRRLILLAPLGWETKTEKSLPGAYHISVSVLLADLWNIRRAGLYGESKKWTGQRVGK
jgi:hypothetical protein